MIRVHWRPLAVLPRHALHALHFITISDPGLICRSELIFHTENLNRETLEV